MGLNEENDVCTSNCCSQCLVTVFSVVLDTILYLKPFLLDLGSHFMHWGKRTTSMLFGKMSKCVVVL